MTTVGSVASPNSDIATLCLLVHLPRLFLPPEHRRLACRQPRLCHPIVRVRLPLLRHPMVQDLLPLSRHPIIRNLLPLFRRALLRVTSLRPGGSMKLPSPLLQDPLGSFLGRRLSNPRSSPKLDTRYYQLTT